MENNKPQEYKYVSQKTIEELREEGKNKTKEELLSSKQILQFLHVLYFSKIWLKIGAYSVIWNIADNIIASLLHQDMSSGGVGFVSTALVLNLVWKFCQDFKIKLPLELEKLMSIFTNTRELESASVFLKETNKLLRQKEEELANQEKRKRK